MACCEPSLARLLAKRYSMYSRLGPTLVKRVDVGRRRGRPWPGPVQGVQGISYLSNFHPPEVQRVGDALDCLDRAVRLRPGRPGET